MVQYYLWNDRRLSFFCELLHSEAIRRTRDSTHQDKAFFLDSISLGKKSEAEAGDLYALRSDVRWSFAVFKGKKVTQEPLP